MNLILDVCWQQAEENLDFINLKEIFDRNHSIPMIFWCNIINISLSYTFDSNSHFINMEIHFFEKRYSKYGFLGRFLVNIFNKLDDKQQK